MNKILFELLTSPLTIFDNYFANYIIMFFLGGIAFKIAFKVVGDIGVRGEFGSFLHWTIRAIALFLLWFGCCTIIYLIKFIIRYRLFISIIFLVIITLYLVVKHINKRITY